MVAVLPRPSDEQIDDYVQFVCNAHSWYKHLPLLPPGVPFRFFIDPNSGCDRVVRAGGHVTYEERTEHSARFHYTWMTTSKYRDRFAHLAYDTDAAPEFALVSAGEAREYAAGPIFATKGVAYRIPVEVAEAGSVLLTAIVHSLTPRVWVWQHFLPPEQFRRWPSDTGGEKTLAEILGVCEREARQNDRLKDEICEDLVRLLEPERKRLQHEMGKAIRRMVQLVYDSKGGRV